MLRFLAPQGRHVAPMGVKIGKEDGTEGTEGLLLRAKFCSIFTKFAEFVPRFRMR